MDQRIGVPITIAARFVLLKLETQVRSIMENH